MMGKKDMKSRMAVAAGDGFCDQGRAAELEGAEEAGSDVNAFNNFGDIINGDVCQLSIQYPLFTPHLP